MKYKNYDTRITYQLGNLKVNILGFCCQKVWIKKDQKWRIREFALVRQVNNNWVFKHPISEIMEEKNYA